ncbi:hypothetical protein [Methylobacterium gnaphalii]|nr:hypothetical protein [Methylobacterium gnaphalii]GJD69908.1 hypothetical protein MMMDOFMJ_2847 [Methylobacterium gnaphalii]
MASTAATTPPKVVLISSNGMGSPNRVRINGNEFDVAGASPIIQGGQIGVSLTLIGVELSAEIVPQAQPAMPGTPAA